MNSGIARSVRTFSSVLAVSLVAAFVAPVAIDMALESADIQTQVSPSAWAQTSKKRQKRALPGISEAFYKKLGKVADRASPPPNSDGTTPEPDYQGALAELRKIEKGCEKCNGYEFAQIYNYYGWINYSLEKYDEAIKYYDKVVQQSPLIPWGLELQVMYTLAQLEFAQERYDNALNRLNRWMKLSETVGAEVYNLKASICYQKDDKKCAQESINTAVQMIEDKGQIAKESWYNLQRALYLEKEDYRSSLPILVKLIRHFPKKSYYQQTASIYGMLEQDNKQLGLLDATYVMGGLGKEQQLLNLVYLMIQNEYPYRAAKVLEKGMADKIVKRSERNLETLGKAWGQAQEKRKAIPVMSEAAKLSDTGDLYGIVMSLYLDIDDSKNAIGAGKKALAKGELKRTGEIHLNIGTAHMDLGEYEKAIESFEEAKKDKRVKRIAENWLKYAKREYSRQQQLRENS